VYTACAWGGRTRTQALEELGGELRGKLAETRKELTGRHQVGLHQLFEHFEVQCGPIDLPSLHEAAL
jgi:hypothetical protein